MLTTSEPDESHADDADAAELVTKQIVFAVENSIDLEDELASRLQRVLSGPSPPQVSYVGVVSDQSVGLALGLALGLGQG